MGSILLYSVLILWLAYAVYIARFVHNMVTRKLLYGTQMDPNLMSHHQSASRYDMATISEIKLILGAMVLMPVRLLIATPMMLLLFVLIWIPKTVMGGKFC